MIRRWLAERSWRRLPLHPSQYRRPWPARPILPLVKVRYRFRQSVPVSLNAGLRTFVLQKPTDKICKTEHQLTVAMMEKDPNLSN